MVEETGIGGEARAFPETRWTLIVRSRADPEARRAALHELLPTYWKPLYFHARRRGLSIEAAKDAVQGVFAHLLEQDFLDRLDPARGRFRAYLKTALDRWLANLREAGAAENRGGGRRIVSLDMDVAAAESELSTAPPAPDAAFEREWALGVMERALGRLRGDFEAGRRRGPLAVALEFFRLDGAAPSYAEATRRAGLSVPELKAFLHRTRVRFRELVREEVAGTVADAGEVEAEVADLVRALSSPPPP